MGLVGFRGAGRNSQHCRRQRTPPRGALIRQLGLNAISNAESSRIGDQCQALR